MDKFEVIGYIYDMLVIVNVDYGGFGKNYGGWDEYNCSIFMVFGGEMVDNGCCLYGGSNVDISVFILNVL